MSQFGGTSDGGFDYYAPQRPSGPSGLGGGTHPQFGAVPAAQPQAPSAPPVWGYGTPAPAPRSRRRRWPYVVLSIVVMLGLLVVGGVMNIRARHHEAIVTPATLGGLAPVTDPSLVGSLDTTELEAQHPGWSVDARAYGSKKGVLLFFAVRGIVDPDREFADFSRASGIKLVTSQPAGRDTTCKSDAAGKVTYCVRTSMFLTVEVASVGLPSSEASAAVDEAWEAQ